ncbi:pentatricopeptide repeat-containing protein [Iris pallida]|uniref:Pentatricopeptide repeat-containing protein n=1 Tax=Iris pallida TaxID=29817 RepID=A0AAX6I850_IRIPA|nr:pentatricopeptide repeat-containing protein [Iris pallida]
MLKPIRSSVLINSIMSHAFSKIDTNLLKTITDTKNLKLGKGFHCQMIISSQFDLILTNYLINLYAKCGDLNFARKVFNEMPERNVVSVSSLMAGYFHNGLPSEVFSVFRLMGFGRLLVRPNEYIFTTVLASCADIQALIEGRQCHAYVLKYGLLFHTYVRNALLHMYSRCSQVEDALVVFKTVLDFDIFSANSIINVFLEHECITEAKNVVRSMVAKIGLWDHITYVSVLSLAAASRDLILGCQAHGQITKRCLEVNDFVRNATVDMYGKCGDVLSSQHAFLGARVRNVVLWTTVMAACTQNGFLEDALKLFLEMVTDGIQPNELTYAVILYSCAGLSVLRNGEAIYALVEKSGHKAHLPVGNALINMYSRCGTIEDAHRVFTTMLQKDIISWNSIISGYSHHGLGREVLEAFRTMLMGGVAPSYATFVGVLSACGHLGLVKEGFYYLNHLMRDFGVVPGIEHHTCLVGILSRAGLLDEAEKYMRYTHVEWDIVAWRTLLSGCRVHRNFRLGKKVAHHILQLDPHDVGTYILLSNIYARESQWDGVLDVRKLMRGRCVKKEPGVSWLQVRNEIHVFTSEDKQHPLINQICEKLEDLITRIKLIGYLPDSSSVLHDVEDEQKQEYLIYHSEKLAISFGLISLPSGAPIHVMKNLRVCADCHTAIKLISNVTGRKIIVRDANRFHCFNHGACSCNDYW